ncbi:MAG: lysylphosphatidylglycerol synthase transmembrane domain-containing protein [Verrucomicrobiia bacterium]
MSQRSPWRSVMLVLRVGVTGGLMGWILWQLDWPLIGEKLAGAEWAWAGLAFVAYGVTTGLAVMRWQLLLRACHTGIRLARTAQLTMIGLFCSAFLPGVVGGDVVKAVYASRELPTRRPAVVVSIMMERLLGFMAMFVTSTALICWRWEALTSEAATRLAVYGYFAFFALVFTGLGVVTFCRVERWLPAFKSRRLKEAYREAGESYRLFIRHPVCFWGGLGISCVAHFSLMAVFYFVAEALRMNLNFWDLAAVLPLVGLVTLLPVTINGFGLREVAFSHFLIFAGMTTEASVTLSLLGTAVIMGWSLLGGAVFLQFRSVVEVPGLVEAAEANRFDVALEEGRGNFRGGS